MPTATGPLAEIHAEFFVRSLTVTTTPSRCRFPDILAGNELFLSSQASIKGTFEDVAPIRLTHGATVLEAVALDADADGDEDVLLIQGPSGTTEPPILLLNRGDGQLRETETLTLDGLSPPAGGWKAGIQMEKIKLDTGEDAVIWGFPDAVTPLRVLPLPTGSGAGGAILKEDWAAITTANLIDVSGTAVHSVDQIKVQDVDRSGSFEVSIVVDGDSFIIFSTSGTTLTNELSMSMPSGISSIEGADIDGDGSLDAVIGSGTDLRILWGPFPPKAQADDVPTLSDWALTGPPYDLENVVPSDYSIDEVLAHDFSGNGYADVIVVARDALGNTIRKLVKVTELEAEARDLSTAAETDIQLSSDVGIEVLDIKKFDMNNDGGKASNSNPAHAHPRSDAAIASLCRSDGSHPQLRRRHVRGHPLSDSGSHRSVEPVRLDHRHNRRTQGGAQSERVANRGRCRVHRRRLEAH